jgi:hypothetical protein
MGLFKKLQENSMYWRYRYVTRRSLAVKRWWRELRQRRTGGIQTLRVRPRGTAAYNPYARAISSGHTTRGIAFVLALAVIWTALSVSTLPQDGILMGILHVGTLAGLTYLFVRYW